MATKAAVTVMIAVGLNLDGSLSQANKPTFCLSETHQTSARRSYPLLTGNIGHKPLLLLGLSGQNQSWPAASVKSVTRNRLSCFRLDTHERSALQYCSTQQQLTPYSTRASTEKRHPPCTPPRRSALGSPPPAAWSPSSGLGASCLPSQRRQCTCRSCCAGPARGGKDNPRAVDSKPNAFHVIGKAGGHRRQRYEASLRGTLGAHTRYGRSRHFGEPPYLCDSRVKIQPVRLTTPPAPSKTRKNTNKFCGLRILCLYFGAVREGPVRTQQPTWSDLFTTSYSQAERMHTADIRTFYLQPSRRTRARPTPAKRNTG